MKNCIELKKELEKVYYVNDGADVELALGQEIPLGRGKIVLHEMPVTLTLYVQKLSKNGNVVYSQNLGPDGHYYFYSRYSEYKMPLYAVKTPIVDVIWSFNLVPFDVLVQRKAGTYSCICYMGNLGMRPAGTTTNYVVTDGKVKATTRQYSPLGDGVWEDLVIEGASYVIEYDKIRKRAGYVTYIRHILTWPHCQAEDLRVALERFFQ